MLHATCVPPESRRSFTERKRGSTGIGIVMGTPIPAESSQPGHLRGTEVDVPIPLGGLPVAGRSASPKLATKPRLTKELLPARRQDALRKLSASGWGLAWWDWWEPDDRRGLCRAAAEPGSWPEVVTTRTSLNLTLRPAIRANASNRRNWREPMNSGFPTRPATLRQFPREIAKQTRRSRKCGTCRQNHRIRGQTPPSTG